VAEPRWELRFDDVQALRSACRELSQGRAFVPDAGDVEPRTRGRLELIHPDDGSVLAAEVEVVTPVEAQSRLGGIGLAVVELEGDPGTFADQSASEAERRAPSAAPPAKNAQQRVRRMSMHEARKAARTGEQPERVALERLYGKQVWEPLLANPKISVAEVARIAKKRNVPRVLLDQIVSNERWIRNGQIRRSLLSNPRLSRDGIQKILRVMPQRELKLIDKQRAYPNAVREAARRMLR
jgi:hypothetical protein